MNPQQMPQQLQTLTSDPHGSRTSETDRITIRAFRAPNDRERCVRFLMEHMRVLEDIGVSSVIRPDISWCTDPDVIVLVAEHDELGMIAGIRLHVAGPNKILPMQQSVEPFDPTIVDVLAHLQDTRTGEVAGLWNAHRFAGRGVPALLFRAVVSLASQLRISSMVTFVAEYVAPYASRCGFQMMEELKDGGNYVYPVPEIRTHAMVLMDPLTLSAATAAERRLIMGLRMRPGRTSLECPKQTPLTVDYALILDPASTISYERVDRWFKDRAA